MIFPRLKQLITSWVIPENIHTLPQAWKKIFLHKQVIIDLSGRGQVLTLQKTSLVRAIKVIFDHRTTIKFGYNFDILKFVKVIAFRYMKQENLGKVSNLHIKKNSDRKSSNIRFQWTKIYYQNK